MKRTSGILAFNFLAGWLAAALPTGGLAAAEMTSYEKREADWRNGAIVYQVLVDRFVPSANLEAKRALYPAPKVLRDWSEPAKPGVYLKDAKLNSQELDFWGGDLQSLSTRLDYIRQLGADVLYLNPIHLAYTNHKYDAFDFKEISPEYGTRQEFKQLAAEVHTRGMKLVLDGVFNHMGRNSPSFRMHSIIRRVPGGTGLPSARSLKAVRGCGPAFKTYLNSTWKTRRCGTTFMPPPIPWCAAICAMARMAGGWIQPLNWGKGTCAT